MSDTTNRVAESLEVEDLFSRFVNHCQTEQKDPRVVPAAGSGVSEQRTHGNGRYEAKTPSPLEAGGGVHLLTRRKSSPPAASEAHNDRISRPLSYSEEAVEEFSNSSEEHPLDIASAPERITARDLDAAVAELSARVGRGELAGVRERITELRSLYPRDALLLRRISEIYEGLGDIPKACECLFYIVSLLFERREFRPMREVLEQILEMKPGHAQALKLQRLIEARLDAQA